LEVVVPASGLVTALEPVLRACDGTWMPRQRNGDRETVDARDRMPVPRKTALHLAPLWLDRKRKKILLRFQ